MYVLSFCAKVSLLQNFSQKNQQLNTFRIITDNLSTEFKVT